MLLLLSFYGSRIVWTAPSCFTRHNQMQQHSFDWSSHKQLCPRPAWRPAEAKVGQPKTTIQVDITNPGVIPGFPFKSIWSTVQDGWQRGQKMPTQTLHFLQAWILQMPVLRAGMSSFPQQELLQLEHPARHASHAPQQLQVWSWNFSGN